MFKEFFQATIYQLRLHWKALGSLALVGSAVAVGIFVFPPLLFHIVLGTVFFCGLWNGIFDFYKKFDEHWQKCMFLFVVSCFICLCSAVFAGLPMLMAPLTAAIWIGGGLAAGLVILTGMEITKFFNNIILPKKAISLEEDAQKLRVVSDFASKNKELSAKNENSFLRCLRALCCCSSSQEDYQKLQVEKSPSKHPEDRSCCSPFESRRQSLHSKIHNGELDKNQAPPRQKML